MKSISLSSHSRNEWFSSLKDSDGKTLVNNEQLIVGCLQRIANALERNNALINQGNALEIEIKKSARLRRELNKLKKEIN